MHYGAKLSSEFKIVYKYTFPISKCISNLIELFLMGYFVLGFYFFLLLFMCLCAHVSISMEVKGQPSVAFSGIIHLVSRGLLLFCSSSGGLGCAARDSLISSLPCWDYKFMPQPSSFMWILGTELMSFFCVANTLLSLQPLYFIFYLVS